MEENMQYWFGFQDGMFSNRGGVVLCGPYVSLDAARTAREEMKQEGNCTVGVPFVASDESAARSKLDIFTP